MSEIVDRGTPLPFETMAANANRALLEAIPGFAAVLDPRGIVVAANKAWQRATGALRFPARGSDYARVLRDHVANGAAEATPLVASFEKVLSGKAMSVVTDHAWPTRGSAERWTFVVQRSDRRGAILVIHRPSLASQQAAELSVFGAAANRVVQLAIGGELLHAVTHDLRQPLAALRLNLTAALELVRRDAPAPSDAAAAIADAIEQGERVSQRLARTQDLVTVRSAKIEPVDLSELAEEVLGIAKTEAIARRVRFQSHLSSDLPAIVGDRRLIRAAVLGLVLDAFGVLNEAPPERVRLSTRRLNTGHVEVAIARYTESTAPNTDWVLSVARAVANVDTAAVSVDSDGKAGTSVRLWWPVET